MDILKKSLAPLSDEAWEEISDQAKIVLKSLLTARKFVDVEGPKGWDYGAVPLGRLDVPKGQPKSDVQFGISQVMPLVEARIPFKLNIWELDNIARGAKDIDLDALEQAATKMANFEEKAIYYGFEAGNIKGLKNTTAHKMMTLPKNVEEVLKSVTEGMSMMKEASVEGPYSIVVNSQRWQEILSYAKGYPFNRQLKDTLGGNIIPSPNIEGIFLVSERGGDYQLTLGMDLSIGYDHHNDKDVQLFFTESFTFQVFEPNAVVVYQ